jgi:isopentenyl-diphosphate delta-isomerase
MGTHDTDFDLKAATADLRAPPGWRSARRSAAKARRSRSKPLDAGTTAATWCWPATPRAPWRPVSGEGIYYAMVGRARGRFRLRGCAGFGPGGGSETRTQDVHAEHGQVFKVLQAMQDAYYKSDERRERFVSLCHDIDVQRLTFEAYMNKKLVKARPLAHLKIGWKNISHLTPGLWANTCCTHPEWDETSIDCAVRRLEEELGITGLAPDYRDRVEYRADVGGGLIEHEVVDIFVAEAPADLSVAPNPDEVMETEWLSYSDLLSRVKDKPDAFTPWLRIYLDSYAERIFGTELASRT